MMFHSTPFLWLVAVTYAAFWMLHRYKWPRLTVLLVSSLVFYGAWNPIPLLVFVVYCAANHVAGRALERIRGKRPGDQRRRKLIMGVTVAFHLTGLILYK